MNGEVLVDEVEAVHFELLGSSEEEVAEDDALNEADDGALYDFEAQFACFVVFVEEDGLEGLPVFDVPAVEMVVFGAVFRREGCQQFWRLREG
jgi:hypothetical protein